MIREKADQAPSVHMCKDDIPGVGFFEDDILSSIRTNAESHIQWIYECMLCRLDEARSLELTEAERKAIRSKAIETYARYIGSIGLIKNNNSSHESL